MKEKRVLHRTWMHGSPDGQAVIRSESVIVTIEWPGDKPPREMTHEESGREISIHGDWKLIPRTRAVGIYPDAELGEGKER